MTPVSIHPLLDTGPAWLDLADVAGDGWAFTFTVDVDLTGYAVAASVVNRSTRAAVVAFSVNVTPAATSTVALALTGAQTAALYGLALDWWLRWTPGGGQPETVLTGCLTAKQL